MVAFSAVAGVFLKGMTSLAALLAPGGLGMAGIIKMADLKTPRAHAENRVVVPCT